MCGGAGACTGPCAFGRGAAGLCGTAAGTAAHDRIDRSGFWCRSGRIGAAGAWRLGCLSAPLVFAFERGIARSCVPLGAFTLTHLTLGPAGPAPYAAAGFAKIGRPGLHDML